MKIAFERSGGFAGMLMSTSVDTAQLPDPEATHLKSLVEASNFFALPAAIASTSPQPDRFQYQLTISEKSRQHTVVVSESAIPSHLRPLLDCLIDRARHPR